MRNINNVSFEELINMNPHETIQVDTGFMFLQILRVPHGWIYNYMNLNNNTSSSVFVPIVNSIGEA